LKLWEFENLKMNFHIFCSHFQILNFQIESDEQDLKLFQRELSRTARESDLAYLEPVAAEYRDRAGGYGDHYRYGLGNGLFRQPGAEAHLFNFQVRTDGRVYS
jgi:hypothetical protein